MLWSDVRSAYPEQWVIIEAMEAHTTPDKKRELDRVAVVEVCPDSNSAMQRYRQLHQAYPGREFYFAHTSREEVEIRVAVARQSSPVV